MVNTNLCASCGVSARVTDTDPTPAGCAPSSSPPVTLEETGLKVGNVLFSPGVKSQGGEIEIRNPDQVVLNLYGGKSDFPIHLRRVPLGTLLGPNFGSWLISEAPGGKLRVRK